MDDPVINDYVVFDIDVEDTRCTEIDLTSIHDADLTRFILRLLNSTLQSSSSRQAYFLKDSDAAPVLAKFADKSAKNDLTKFAESLLQSEIEYNKRIAQLGVKIRAGSLIVATISKREKNYLIVAKIEFLDFLSRDSFISTTGLPEEKSLSRKCLITLDGNRLGENLLLSGSDGNIPAYFYEGFLQASFSRDNSSNTETSFKLIESKLSPIKQISVNDYVDLRDCLVGYYKSNSNFVFDDLVTILTENFKPENEHVDLSELKAKLLSLSEKNFFDGTFEIDKKAVRQRVRKKYNLSNDVEVVAHSGTSSIYRTEENSKRYVVIESANIPEDLKRIKFSHE